MNNNAETAGSRTDLRNKDNLIVPEGAVKDITCELSRKRKKWLDAVVYFTYVDDVNF